MLYEQVGIPEVQLCESDGLASQKSNTRMHHLSFLEHTNYKLLSQIIVGLSVIGQCKRKAKGESVIQHVSQNNFGRSDGAVAEWQLLTSRAFLLLPDILAVKSCSQLCHVDFYLWRLA